MKFSFRLLILLFFLIINNVSAQFSIAQPENHNETVSMTPLSIQNDWWNIVKNEYIKTKKSDVLVNYLNQIRTMLEESKNSENLVEDIDRILGLINEWTEKQTQHQLAPGIIENKDEIVDSSIEFLLNLNSQRLQLTNEINRLSSSKKEFEVSIQSREKEINNLKVTYKGLIDPTLEKLEVELIWIETKIQQEIEGFILEDINQEIKSKKNNLENIENQFKEITPQFEYNDSKEKKLVDFKKQYKKLEEKLYTKNNQFQEQIRKSPIDQNKYINDEFGIMKLSAELNAVELEIITLNTFKILSDPDSGADLKRSLYIDNEKLIEIVVDNIDRWVKKTNSFFNDSTDLTINETQTEGDQKLLEEIQEKALNLRASISKIKTKISEIEIIQDSLFKTISENNNISTDVYNLVLTGASITIDSIIDFIYEPLFMIGDTPITLLPLIKLMLIIMIGYLATKLVTFLIHRHQKKKKVEYNSSLYLFHRIVHYLIIVVAIMTGLNTLGLNLSNLTLIAGALSVGIGFGLQNIVSNFVSGLTIMIEKTLSVGDFIELDNGTTGTVKAINARYTQINTNDNIDVIIPNADLVTNPVINWTLKDSMRRIKIPFGVAYGTERSIVERAGMEAAENVEFTVNNETKKPYVCITGFGDSSIDYLLLIWVSTKGLYKPNRMRALYYHELEDKFKKYNIEIPYPQRDVRIFKQIED